MSSPEYYPGLADVPAAESAISFIDGKRARLEYRGIAVETLAHQSFFEETSWLLLKGELPRQKELADFDAALKQERCIHFRLLDVLKSLPENGHPMSALQAGTAALAMFHPMADVTNPDNNWDATIQLIAKLPTIVAAFHRIRNGHVAVFQCECELFFFVVIICGNDWFSCLCLAHSERLNGTCS